MGHHWRSGSAAEPTSDWTQACWKFCFALPIAAVDTMDHPSQRLSSGITDMSSHHNQPNANIQGVGANRRGGGECGVGMAGSSCGKHGRESSPGGWHPRLIEQSRYAAKLFGGA